jgi:hypothetical protein
MLEFMLLHILFYNLILFSINYKRESGKGYVWALVFVLFRSPSPHNEEGYKLILALVARLQLLNPLE